MDWVSRGSITGGSQAEARVRVPPRFGGLVLAAIQSGYETELCAEAREPGPLVPSTAAPTATRVRNWRRFTGVGIVGAPSRIETSPRRKGRGIALVVVALPELVKRRTLSTDRAWIILSALQWREEIGHATD